MDLKSAARGAATACGQADSCALAEKCSPSSRSCVTPTARADLEARIREHPCYSERAHHHFARMHLPVAPACNVQCNYCNRKYDCSNESRPGVTSRVMSPEDASRRVWEISKRLPQLSVVGIAGPGDALANPARTFRTFELIRDHSPDLKLCLSTNGLALADHVETIRRLGVDHVTITINAVDPDIASRIYAWAMIDGRKRTGASASEALIERQLAGLRALVRNDVLVKINSVMIPGVNDDHLKAVHDAVGGLGAFIHNVIPLISDPAHGTAFGLAGVRGPRPQALTRLQDALGGDMKIMRHCRQCRADAIGLLGEDCASGEPENLPVCADPHERRADYRRAVAAELVALPPGAGRPKPEREYLVAVAGRGGDRINEHFGKARVFGVYAVGDGGVRLVGYRPVAPYCRDDPEAQDRALRETVDTLGDCRAVFAAKIGPSPAETLRCAGLEPVEAYAFQKIETALADWGRAGALLKAVS